LSDIWNLVMNERRKKQIQIWLEDVRVYLWLPTLLVFLLSFLLWNSAGLHHELKVRLSAEKPGTVQLFIDDGSGFSESNSLLFEIPTSKVSNKFTFDLDAYPNIVQLRLDPINNDGFVILSKLDYKRKGEWLHRSLLKPEYVISNGVRFQWNAKQRELGIYPEKGNMDPSFLLEADWGRFSDRTILSKRLAMHGFALLLGLLLGLLFQKQIVRLLIPLWIWLGIPWILIKKARNAYRNWVDRESVKWRLVNPTSCVVAGGLIAVWAWFAWQDTSLFTQTTERMAPKLVFEIKQGRAVGSYAFFNLPEIKKYPDFHSLNKGPIESMESVVIPFSYFNAKITGIRIDPMDEKGEIELSNLRILLPGNVPQMLSFEGWRAKGSASIDSNTGTSILLFSNGDDPNIVSPNLDIRLNPPKTFPVRFGFPLVIFFFVTTGLLLYNHLQTEDLSEEQIRNLQQM